MHAIRAEILRLSLSLRLRSFVAYTIGIALYTLVVVTIYPQFRHTTSLNHLATGGSATAALLGVSGPLTSPSGWLNANVYENFLPLVMLLVTVGYGAAAIAGQDEDGTLALLVVLPVRRSSLLLQTAAAIAIQALLLAATVGSLVVVGRFFDLNLPAGHIIGITASLFLLGFDFGVIALAVGAGTGRRAFALGITATIAAISYLLSSLAPVVDWIDWTRYLSLFYWAIGDSQLRTGVTAGDLAVLAVVGACALAAAVVAFARLDLH